VGLEASSRQPGVTAVVLQQHATVQAKYCAGVLHIESNWRFTFYMSFSSISLAKLKALAGD